MKSPGAEPEGQVLDAGPRLPENPQPPYPSVFPLKSEGHDRPMRLIALVITGVIAPFCPPLPYGAGHRGVDFAARVGQVVSAPSSGRITYAGYIDGVGTITISLGSRKITLQPVAPLVGVADEVARGNILGRIQSTRYHCSSCLHIGVRENGRYVNPLFLTKSELLPVGRSVWIDDH